METNKPDWVVTRKEYFGDDEIQSTPVKITKEKKSKPNLLDKILRYTGLFSIGIPFILFFLQYSSQIKRQQTDDLTQTYIDFAVDMETSLSIGAHESGFNTARENLLFKYPAKFAVLQKDTLNALYQSLLSSFKFYITIKKTVEAGDSILKTFDYLFGSYSYVEIKGRKSEFTEILNNRSKPEIMSAIEKSFNLINELNTSIHLLDPELELDSSVVIKLQRIDRFENTLDSLEDAGQDYKDYLADLKKYLSGDPNSLIQNPVKNKNFDPLDAKLVMEDMFNRLKEVQKQLEEQLSKKRLQIQAVILHLIK